ncbi:MAG: alpha/beta hydrolase family protein, partial [Candidatus Sericytochromatia bacterium]
TYPNPKAGNQLAGTLTLPEGKGPFPAVLLITGSGAQDRDQTIFGHKSFLLIADHLTRRGIAVLRVDDRGIGGSTGDPNGTSLDFATDVEAGLAFLKAHPAVRKGQIGLLGHSEGGLIAPIVAARHPEDVAFLVLLAAQATTGGEAVMDQVRIYTEAHGEGKAAVDRKLALQRKVYEVLRQHDPQAAVQPLRALLADQFGQSPEGKQQLEAQIQAVNSPWFRTFVELDPRPYLAKIEVPVLALNGSKDTQVLAKKHLPGLKAALHESPSVKTYELPGLNHLFQPAKTGLPSEYGQIETTFDPEALELIGDWVEARTSRK